MLAGKNMEIEFTKDKLQKAEAVLNEKTSEIEDLQKRLKEQMQRAEEEKTTLQDQLEEKKREVEEEKKKLLARIDISEAENKRLQGKLEEKYRKIEEEFEGKIQKKDMELTKLKERIQKTEEEKKALLDLKGKDIEIRSKMKRFNLNLKDYNRCWL